MTARTPEELLGHFVRVNGTHRANAVPGIPGTPGHCESGDPWTSPVMVIAGGDPWLYLAGICGWWLGFGPHESLSVLAKVQDAHLSGCKTCGKYARKEAAK